MRISITGWLSLDVTKHEIAKRPSRKERERKILIELVEYYIKTGRPVGSQVLQGETILDVSSATIRNYFQALEEDGFLKQQHTSGGRIPQGKAFSIYARHCLDEHLSQRMKKAKKGKGGSEAKKRLFDFESLAALSTSEVVSYIHEVIAQVAKETSMAVIASSPKFDNDSIVDIKYVYLDSRRALAVVTTEFGFVHTAIVVSSNKSSLSPGLVRKAEHFARMRLFQESSICDTFDQEEMEIARSLYQETIASYFVMYSNSPHEDIYRAGFSNLLAYPEFQDSLLLAPAMALFENSSMLKGLLRESCRANEIKFWIGDELQPYTRGDASLQVSLIAAPYRVGSKPVGALALLGPMRMIYKDAFKLMQEVSDFLSNELTQAFIRYRISYKMPESQAAMVDDAYKLAIEFHPHQ